MGGGGILDRESGGWIEGVKEGVWVSEGREEEGE